MSTLTLENSGFDREYWEYQRHYYSLGQTRSTTTKTNPVWVVEPCFDSHYSSVSIFFCLFSSPAVLPHFTLVKNGKRDGAKVESRYFYPGLVISPRISRSISDWLEYLKFKQLNRGRPEELYCDRDISIWVQWVWRVCGSIWYQNHRAIWWKACVNGEMRNSSRGLSLASSWLFFSSVKASVLPIYLTLWCVTSKSRIYRLNGNHIFLEKR